jgi:hypothetical protein
LIKVIENERIALITCNIFSPNFCPMNYISHRWRRLPSPNYQSQFFITALFLILLYPVMGQVQFVQQGDKLTSIDAVRLSLQGTSVAISADGKTAVVGGPLDGFAGAAWLDKSGWSSLVADAWQEKSGLRSLGGEVWLHNPDWISMAGGDQPGDLRRERPLVSWDCLGIGLGLC